jgi:hypothetical protein
MQREELVRGLLLLDQVEQLCKACLIGKQRLGAMLHNGPSHLSWWPLCPFNLCLHALFLLFKYLLHRLNL